VLPPRRDARRAALAILAPASLTLCAPALARPARPAAVGVHLAGRTALAKAESSTVLLDRGTITGSPVGSGRITLVYTLHPATGLASTSFTIVNARGTVTGQARSSYDVTRLHITFTGVGSLTGGTGAYAGLRARMLQFDAIHSITGRREAVALIGRATRS
jgi:hypothetical protein